MAACVRECVCECVCVSERTCVTAFYLYRRMCDMLFFFLTDTEHTPTTPVPRSRRLSLGGVREGCRCCSNKNCSLFFFFLGKRQKSRCCNWNSFQLVSAYFNLFLYCDGKIKKCTDRSKRGPLCLFVPPRCGPMWNHSVEIIDVSNDFIYRGKSAQNNHSQTCWPGFAKGQICVLIWESNMWTCF